MRAEAQLFLSPVRRNPLENPLAAHGAERTLCNRFYGDPGHYPAQGLPALRTLYHAGLVIDRRDRLCVYYRISVALGSREHKLLLLLREMLASLPIVKTLRQKMQKWLRITSYQTSQR
jgi:hypothetical protein